MSKQERSRAKRPEAEPDLRRHKECVSISEQNFQPGDIVRMRSGGPPMTVTRVNRQRAVVSCLWFEARKKPHYYYFEAAALEAAVPDTKEQVSANKRD